MLFRGPWRGKVWEPLIYGGLAPMLRFFWNPRTVGPKKVAPGTKYQVFFIMETCTSVEENSVNRYYSSTVNAPIESVHLYHDRIPITLTSIVIGRPQTTVGHKCHIKSELLGVIGQLRLYRSTTSVNHKARWVEAAFDFAVSSLSWH